MKISLKEKLALLKRLIKIELKGSIADCKYYIKNRKVKKENGLAVSYQYLYGDVSQVSSQKYFLNKYIETFEPVIFHSNIGYFLWRKKLKNIFSHEIGWAAPLIFYKGQKVLLFSSDLHNKWWLSRYLKHSAIYKILTPYKFLQKDISFLSHIDEDVFVNFPWAIPDSWIKDIEVVEPKSNCIYTFGAMAQKDAYSFRRWIAKHPMLDEAYNFGGSENYKYKEAEYFSWLNTLDAVVVATGEGIYNYSVAKLIEVPASGALLFAKKTIDFDTLGFIDGINCIVIDKDNFTEKAEEYKSKPESFIDIRRNGYDLIKNNHLVSNRIKLIAEYFEENDDEK